MRSSESASGAVLERPLRPNGRALFWSARMSPALDEISLQFVIHSRTTQGTVADIGCGDGVAIAAALLRGAHVHAVDPDQTALDRLLDRVPKEQHCRLQITRAALPRVDFQ